jgi:DNA-directed RNA polymerase II subunit RPB2
VKFGDIYVTPPAVFEVDGTVRELYPAEARLRSLTYSSPVYIDISTKQFLIDEVTRKYNPEDEPVKTKEFKHEFLG